MSVDSTALSSEAQQLFEAAMKLPERERAKLIDKLALSVDPMADPEWQAAWGPEIARRIAEVDNGTAKLHTWHELQHLVEDARHA
ncbi:MAG TPA: addiction module protein [Pirellulales bacterium]|nr:addiction module protein [Pirellulales bacterium]